MNWILAFFQWVGLGIVALGSAYAFYWLVRDGIEYVDNHWRARRFGFCSRLGCTRAAVVQSGDGDYKYCGDHADTAGWEPMAEYYGTRR